METNWTTFRLTTSESQKALLKAGIPLDPADWQGDDMQRAQQALDDAQLLKIARLLGIAPDDIRVDRAKS